VSGDQEPQKFKFPLNDMVERLYDFYDDVEGYNHLYVVAHELSRAAEALLEKARFIEDIESALLVGENNLPIGVQLIGPVEKVDRLLRTVRWLQLHLVQAT
tara:strand:- start:88 stop:390 length:303 start_codon:yes stop_codon:yes gene_type:complete